MEPEKRHFIHLIKGNHGIVRSLCKAYYASYEDQRDAYQDIVLQLWKSYETFRGECQVSTWIYRVSLNTLLAKRRNDRNKIMTEPLPTDDHGAPMADDDRELLGMVMQSLKDVDKAIVILFLEGYKNKEIADMLGLTATNVSTRLNRIRTDLKAKFENHRHELQ